MTTAAAQQKKKAIDTNAFALAEENAKAWLRLKLKKAEIDSEMKLRAESLETFARNNRSAFGDMGTLKVGPTKLKFVNAGKIKTSPDFDALDFATNYPELVNISVSVASMKGYLIDEEKAEDMQAQGVEYITEEKFSVEKA